MSWSQLIKESKYKNHDCFIPRITGDILCSNDHTLDNEQKMIMQCTNNLIRTPVKLFTFSLPRKDDALLDREVYLYVSGTKDILIDRLLNPPQEQKPTSFSRVRQGILHHSPMCNDPACNNKVADFFHMVKHPSSKELVTDKQFAPIPPFWTDFSDPDPTPPPFPPITNNTPLGKDEDIIANHLKLASESHLRERKRNVKAWINHDKDLLVAEDSYEISIKRRGTLGYFPSDLYWKLSTHFNDRKLTDKVAQKIILLQIRTWIKIRKKFWKERFDRMKAAVNLNLLKTYRYQSRDET